VADLPGYPSWKKQARIDKRSAEAGCIHCHQASEIMREPALTAKTFSKDHDLQIWPFPENVGIKLDRDDGLKITNVIAGSPAEKAGVKSGDVLAAAGSDGTMRKLFGQADFRGVLHRARSNTVDIYWLHDGKPTEGHLALADGWRKTQLGWRRSISQGNIGCGPGFFPLPASAAERTKLGLPAGTMMVKAFYPNGTAKAAGLTQTDFVIAVEGEKPDVSANPFNVWFRLHHDVGDPVTLTVIRPDGKQATISYKAAPWTN
jgi:S1-C subfamily serine protease